MMNSRRCDTIMKCTTLPYSASAQNNKQKTSNSILLNNTTINSTAVIKLQSRAFPRTPRQNTPQNLSLAAHRFGFDSDAFV